MANCQVSFFPPLVLIPHYLYIVLHNRPNAGRAVIWIFLINRKEMPDCRLDNEALLNARSLSRALSLSLRGQLHQQCCEEWTLVSEETQAKMARMAAAAAWGLGTEACTLHFYDSKAVYEAYRCF